MENLFVTSINKVKKDFCVFLGEIFSAKPDEEILQYSVGIEEEFETLEMLVKEKKDTFETITAIRRYIDLLLEKIKYFAAALKLSYLRDKFELCIRDTNLELAN